LGDSWTSQAAEPSGQFLIFFLMWLTGVFPNEFFANKAAEPSGHFTGIVDAFTEKVDFFLKELTTSKTVVCKVMD
jgi:hypothetical protein